jgi:hypothetical protein
VANYVDRRVEVRDHAARRVAKREGLELHKLRRYRSDAWDHGHYFLVKPANSSRAKKWNPNRPNLPGHARRFVSLEAVESYLRTPPRERSPLWANDDVDAPDDLGD